MTASSLSVHALFAPSSAHLWARGCPASARMMVRYPDDEDSPASREGTAAHYYVTEVLAGRPAPTVAPNGHPIDEEMREAGASFITDVRDTLAGASPGLVLRIEERAHAAESIHPDNWGTPDVFIVDWPRKVLHVWDYKYGHRYVSAVDNAQMINYAIAIIESEGIRTVEGWRIILNIGQPRNYHPDGPIRTWQLPLGKLQAETYNFRAAAEVAFRQAAPFRTGDHCRDCSARWACPAIMRVAAFAIDVSLNTEAMEISDDGAAVELRYLIAAEARIKARRTGLEARLEGALRAGRRVRGWAMEPGKTLERWSVEAEAILAIGDMLGVDLRKPEAAVTPHQARKLLERQSGIDGSVIAEYAERPPGAMKLVPAADPALTFPTP